MPQFVMKGYTVDALDYVLKRIFYFAFSQRIERAVARVKNRTDKYITIPIKSGMQKLQILKKALMDALNDYMNEVGK